MDVEWRIFDEEARYEENDSPPAEHFPEEILNIPPEPGRQPRIPEGG